MGVRWTNLSATCDFKKAYDTVTNGILYNIPAGFIAPKKF